MGASAVGVWPSPAPGWSGCLLDASPDHGLGAGARGLLRRLPGDRPLDVGRYDLRRDVLATPANRDDCGDRVRRVPHRAARRTSTIAGTLGQGRRGVLQAG